MNSIIQDLQNKLQELSRREPTPATAAEARKLVIMLEAIKTQSANDAAILLKVMPYIEITHNGNVHPVNPPKELQGLGSFMDFFQKAAGVVKKVVQGAKSANANNPAPATGERPVVRFFQNIGTKIKDKVKGFAPSVTVKHQVDATSGIEKNWWKYLIGGTIATGIAVGGYKLATSK